MERLPDYHHLPDHHHMFGTLVLGLVLACA